MTKQTFDVEIDGKTVTLRVNTPSGVVLKDAQLEYSAVWSKAVKAGAMLKAKLDDYLRAQNMWDDERQQKYLKIVKTIAEGEKVLSTGRIKLKDARDVALDVADARSELMALVSQRVDMETNTAEGQAENARFNYILTRCLVYNDTGLPFYKNVEEFLENSDSKVAVQASHLLASVYMGLDDSYEEKRAELKFLKKYKFIDDEGRLIDKEGNYINRDGKRVDAEGAPTQEEGAQPEVQPEFEPFLDDDGNPITE